jgi:hypothetical protein
MVNDESQPMIQSARRPTLISVFAVIVIVATLLSVVFQLIGPFSGVATSLYGGGSGALSIIVIILEGFVQILAMVGYWKMKKWGVYLYTTQAVVSFILNAFLLKIYSNMFGVVATLTLPVILIIIGFSYLKRMQSTANARESIFLIGLFTFAVAIILQLVLILAFPNSNSNIQAASGNLPPVAPISQSALASAQDCGSDFSCFVNGAQMCAPTKVLAQISGNTAGLMATVQDNMLIYGTPNNCILDSAAVGGSVTMSSDLVVQYKAKGYTDAQIAQAQAQFQAASQNSDYSRLGVTMCQSNSNNLISALNDLQKTGSFSLSDDLLAHCVRSASTSNPVVNEFLTTHTQALGPAGSPLAMVSVTIPNNFEISPNFQGDPLTVAIQPATTTLINYLPNLLVSATSMALSNVLAFEKHGVQVDYPQATYTDTPTTFAGYPAHLVTFTVAPYVTEVYIFQANGFTFKIGKTFPNQTNPLNATVDNIEASIKVSQ